MNCKHPETSNGSSFYEDYYVDSTTGDSIDYYLPKVEEQETEEAPNVQCFDYRTVRVATLNSPRYLSFDYPKKPRTGRSPSNSGKNYRAKGYNNYS